MMQHVAGDDERDGENGDWLAARGAAAEPGRVIERADKGDGGAANGREFLQ